MLGLTCLVLGIFSRLAGIKSGEYSQRSGMDLHEILQMVAIRPESVLLKTIPWTVWAAGL